MNKTAFSLKLKDALMSRLSERRQKTLIGLVRYIEKWENAFYRKPIIRSQ